MLVNVVWQFLSLLVLTSFQSTVYCLNLFVYASREESSFGSKGDELIQNVLDLCISEVTFYSLNDSFLLSVEGAVVWQADCDDEYL